MLYCILVCHSGLERRKHWATPPLTDYGSPPGFYADTADRTETMKGFGESVRSKVQNFKCVNYFSKFYSN